MDARCDELREEVKEKNAAIQELERRIAEHGAQTVSTADVQQLEQTNDRLKLAVAALERRTEKQKVRARMQYMS